MEPIMEKPSVRKYSSPVRERQANLTKNNILDATQRLFLERGYTKTTIEAIAQEAGVSKQTVYAVFRSKRGIVAGLMDRAVLTEHLFELCDKTLEASSVEEAFLLTAELIYQVHESKSPVFELLRGAGALDPELAHIENECRCAHRADQEEHVRYLLRGRQLKDGVTLDMALDVFWCLTSGEVYRMLILERGWSGENYIKWLHSMLVSSLLRVSEASPEQQDELDKEKRDSLEKYRQDRAERRLRTSR